MPIASPRYAFNAVMVSGAPPDPGVYALWEGDELIYVLEGEIAQTVDGETIRLSAGDSLHFRGSSDHAWANETGENTKLLWVGTMAILRPRQEGHRPGDDATAGEAVPLHQSPSDGSTRS
jgi:hypothetical protein